MSKLKIFILTALIVIIFIGYHWYSRPVVSVVMLTYKRADLVSNAINSILNQTYKDFEFIILNDGSPDNTDEVIAKYKDNRIRYYKNSKNMGIAYSRNKVTKLARGKYIMIMDDDDISLSTRMEKQVKFLEQNPNIDVVAGQIEGLSIIPQNHDDIVISLIQYNNIGNANIMYKNSFVKKNNITYNLQQIVSEDWDFWLKMLFKGAKFASIPDIVLRRDGASKKHYPIGYEEGNHKIREYIGTYFSNSTPNKFYEASPCDKAKMVKEKNILSTDFVQRLIKINCN